MLEVRDLFAGYGALSVLFGVNLKLDDGSCLALIGANGAGKSTTFACLTGILRPDGGKISMRGKDLTGCDARQMLRSGIAVVPEGRKLFASLTVEENLLAGAFLGRAGSWGLDRVYDTFPTLIPLRRRRATQLSGGQQQLVAIGRALMSNPAILLCDEISLGLSPAPVDVVYQGLAKVRADGVSLVLVEQDITRALSESDHFACMQHGRIVLEGQSATAEREAISAAYFGAHRNA